MRRALEIITFTIGLAFMLEGINIHNLEMLIVGSTMVVLAAVSTHAQRTNQ